MFYSDEAIKLLNEKFVCFAPGWFINSKDDVYQEAWKRFYSAKPRPDEGSGWLRGTQILTAVVSKRFTQEGAELLHQPDLLRYFGDRLTAMPEYSVPVVESIKRALVEVRPLINSGNKPISPEAVKKINEITTRLDGEIVTR